MTRSQIMNLCHQWADRAKLAWGQVVNRPLTSHTARPDADPGDAALDPERASAVGRPGPPTPRATGLNGSRP